MRLCCRPFSASLVVRSAKSGGSTIPPVVLSLYGPSSWNPSCCFLQMLFFPITSRLVHAHRILCLRHSRLKHFGPSRRHPLLPPCQSLPTPLCECAILPSIPPLKGGSRAPLRFLLPSVSDRFLSCPKHSCSMSFSPTDSGPYVFFPQPVAHDPPALSLVTRDSSAMVFPLSSSGYPPHSSPPLPLCYFPLSNTYLPLLLAAEPTDRSPNIPPPLFLMVRRRGSGSVLIVVPPTATHTEHTALVCVR